MFRAKLINRLSVLVCFALVLTACGRATQTPTPEATATPATATEPPVTETPATATEPPVTETPATATETETPIPDDQTLTFGVWGTTSPNNFCTLSPTTGLEEIWRNRFVGATLLTLSPNNEWVPNLAESWEANEDGTTYAFHLYPNVKWHDGEPFTARDVVLTFELLLNPDIGSYGALLRDIIAEVNAVDDFTVVFTMTRPIVPGDFTTKSAFWNLVQGWIPVPQHILRDIPAAEICSSDWAQSNYVSLGPFRVAEFVRDERVIYERYQDYHLGPSQLEQIRIQFSNDPTFLYEALLAGEFNMAQITPEFIDDIEQNDNFLLPLETSLIAVRQTDWPPEDPYVQQALVEPEHETFVPYRETLEEIKAVIGDADLFPLHSEMSAAIDSLRDTTEVEFNLSRAVRLVDVENQNKVSVWAPIGPENVQLYRGVDNVDQFWDIVNREGGLDIGIAVIEDVPTVARAFVDEGTRQIQLIGTQGEILKIIQGEEVRSGTATPVEIPIARIDIGTLWCQTQIWGVYVEYPCGW
jgi:hypothetical protein